MIRESERINGFRPSCRKALLTGLYWVFFAGLVILLLWKCRYGYVSPDEGFYLVTPYRFVRGDRMLLQEWHMSQFASFTMIPGVWLYLQIAGTTTGIILFFRYLYSLCWAAFSAFLYLRTRPIHRIGAMCASLFLLCYAPYGIMAFSYNSLGILYLSNALFFLLCPGKHKKAEYILSGVFFAAAVLCCPYLAGIYLIYSTLLILRRGRKKPMALLSDKMNPAAVWKLFSLGICILAVLFLCALCLGTSPRELLHSLSFALQDEEHSTFSPLRKLTTYFQSLFHSNDYFLPITGLLVALLALNRFHPSALWFCILCAAEVLFLRRGMQLQPYINRLMLPITFLGIYAALTTREQKARQIAFFWLLPGLLYTFCLHYSSNQDILAISSAAAVSSAGSFLMIWLYCDELKAHHGIGKVEKALRRLAQAMVFICFLFQMRYEVPLRYQSVFQEQGLMENKAPAKMESGPQQGILTTGEHAGEYLQLREDLRELDHRKVLVLFGQTWMYLENENEIAAFSAWLGSINNNWDKLVSEATLNRLRNYYTLQPEKIPEVVFVGMGNESSVLTLFPDSDLKTDSLSDGNVLVWITPAKESAVQMIPSWGK